MCELSLPLSALSSVYDTGFPPFRGKCLFEKLRKAIKSLLTNASDKIPQIFQTINRHCNLCKESIPRTPVLMRHWIIRNMKASHLFRCP